MDLLNRITFRVSARGDAHHEPSRDYVWYDGMDENAKRGEEHDAFVAVDAPGDYDKTVRISLCDWDDAYPGDGVEMRASIEMTAVQVRRLAERLAFVVAQMEAPP